METLEPVRTPEVVAPGSGHHLHFLNHLATLKVRSGETGTMSVVEFTAPRGFGPPLHQHTNEDELFVVLDGEIAFHAGETHTHATSGGIALLPAGIAHTFQVHSATARFVCVTADRRGGPAGFDRFVAALGVPAPAAVLPEPDYIDANHVAEVCAAHGIDVVGPPPAPLEGART